jgi:hypothetical protein
LGCLAFVTDSKRRPLFWRVGAWKWFGAAIGVVVVGQLPGNPRHDGELQNPSQSNKLPCGSLTWISWTCSPFAVPTARAAPRLAHFASVGARMNQASIRPPCLQ